MATFDLAYKITSGIEGGYVYDPEDAGGETYCGISRNASPDWRGWIIIDALKSKYQRDRLKLELSKDDGLKKLVTSLFFEQYWNANRLTAISNQAIANEVYDTGVNMGVGVAATFLQEAYNLLSNNGKNYHPIAEDGKIGIITIMAINNHPKQKELLMTLNILQGAKYVDICRNNPAQQKFFAGWIQRVSV